MSPKPPLTLVGPGATAPPPPRTLSAPGLALWNRVQAEYRILDCGGAEILCLACEATDRIQSLAAAIAEDGEQGLRELYVALTRPTKTLVVVHSKPHGLVAVG